MGFLLRLVLLAGRDREQRWFRGRRDLDCSAPRVRWLRTPLCGKAKAQGTRLSKPEKKGMRVMVAPYLPSSYLISTSILSNPGAHLISYLIYGCGLVSS